MHNNNRDGQGYVEVMVVIGILLVIALFAIPRYLDLRRDAYMAQIANDSRLVETYVVEHYFKTGEMPDGSLYVSDNTIDTKKDMYLQGGKLDSISDVGGSKYLLDKEEVLKNINTKLKGDFIYTEGGIIYSEEKLTIGDVYDEEVVKELEDIIGKLEEELKYSNNIHKKDKEKLENKIRELTLEINKLKEYEKKYNLNQKELVEIQNQLNIKNLEITKLKESNKSLNNELDGLNEEIEGLNNKIVENQDKINTLNKELESKEKEIEQIQNNLNLSNKEKQDKINELLIVIGDNKKYQDDLKNQLKEYKDSILELENKKKELSEKIVQLEKESDKNNDLISSLKNTINNKNKVINDKTELIEKLNTELINSNKSNKDKDEILKQKTIELEQLIDERNDIAAKLIQAEQNVVALNKLIKEKDNAIEDQKNIITAKINEITILKEDKALLNTQVDDLNITINNIEKEIERIKENNTLANKEYEQKIDKLEKEKIELNNSISKLKVELNAKENTIKDFQANINDFKNSNEQLNAEKKDLEGKLIEYEETISNQNISIKDLKGKLQKAQNESKTLQEKLNLAEANIQEIKKELKNSQIEINNYVSQITTLTKENKELKQKLTSNSNEIKRLNSLNKDLQNKYDSLNTEYYRYKSQKEIQYKIAQKINSLHLTENYQDGLYLIEEITIDIDTLKYDEDRDEKKLDLERAKKEYFLRYGIEVEKIYAKGLNSAMVTKGGDFYTWGEGNFVLEHKDDSFQRFPAKFEKIPNIKELILSYNCVGLITKDGSLYTWGDGSYGKLGHGDKIKYKSMPTLVRYFNDNKLKVKQVALGDYHSAAITEDGSLYTWGKGGEGALGHGDVKDRNTPTKVKYFEQNNLYVKYVVLGNWVSAVITENGDLYTWGNGGTEGLLGYGYDDGNNQLKPKKVESISNVKQVAFGQDHSAAITENGTLYTWGNGADGKLGYGDEEDRFAPTKVNNIPKVKQISLSWNHSAAITEDGELYTWGWGNDGKLGHGDKEDQYEPKKVQGISNVKQIVFECNYPAALLENGEIYSWGCKKNGKFDPENTKCSLRPTQVEYFKKIRKY